MSELDDLDETTKYYVHVFASDEDGGFIAIAPSLPGCSAFGETKQEAIAEIQNAIEAWIGAAKAVGTSK